MSVEDAAGYVAAAYGAILFGLIVMYAFTARRLAAITKQVRALREAVAARRAATAAPPGPAAPPPGSPPERPSSNVAG